MELESSHLKHENRGSTPSTSSLTKLAVNSNLSHSTTPGKQENYSVKTFGTAAKSSLVA